MTSMGGSRSEEFLHPTPIGEDTFVRSAGGYAANVEAVTTVVPDEIPLEGLPAAHVEDTPDTPTIETLVAVAQQLFPEEGYTAASTLKNVVVLLVHRSEEHTSELQSRQYLVCRLLLEKKKWKARER